MLGEAQCGPLWYLGIKDQNTLNVSNQNITMFKGSFTRESRTYSRYYHLYTCDIRVII